MQPITSFTTPLPVINLPPPLLFLTPQGFGEQLTTRSRPEIGSLFKQALDLVLRSLQRLPHSKPLRRRAISFFHRMVDTLGSSVFPFLPAAIQQLLVECEVSRTGGAVDSRDKLWSVAGRVSV